MELDKNVSFKVGHSYSLKSEEYPLIISLIFHYYLVYIHSFDEEYGNRYVFKYITCNIIICRYMLI